MDVSKRTRQIIKHVTIFVSSLHTEQCDTSKAKIFYSKLRSWLVNIYRTLYLIAA